MTSTETAPRKRAPRKTTAAKNAEAAEARAGGVDARKAQEIRERIEAETGEQVTAAAGRRIRGGVTGYKVIRPDGEPTPEQRRAAAAAHPDDPGPAAPGLEDDPDAAGDQPNPAHTFTAGSAMTTPPDQPDPSPATPPAEVSLDDVAAIAAGLVELGTAVAAEQAADRALELDVDDFDHGDDQAPAELPAGATVCGPGTPTAGDVAAIAAFGEQLEARQRAAAALDVDEAELDLRTLVAVDLGGPVDFDLSTLVAGHVATAPDGRRVTVLEQPARPAADTFDAAAFVAMRQAYDDAQAVDTATGEILLEGDDPTRVKLSAELAAAIEEARGLEARAGELTEAADAIRAQVREALGGETGRGEEAIAPDGTKLASWSRYVETRLDGKALKAAHPEVWAAFAKTSPRRRFTWAD